MEVAEKNQIEEVKNISDEELVNVSGGAERIGRLAFRQGVSLDESSQEAAAGLVIPDLDKNE